MYFFSFIYNMLKCQKEEKGFCKTQKYELQLLPAACCFHKNELEPVSYTHLDVYKRQVIVYVVRGIDKQRAFTSTKRI